MKNLVKTLDADVAERIALQALSFLAGDAERLGRFLALTGLGPAELKASAGSPGTLAAVLDHLLADETLLLVFSSETGVAPDLIAPCRDLLTGGPRHRARP